MRTSGDFRKSSRSHIDNFRFARGERAKAVSAKFVSDRSTSPRIENGPAYVHVTKLIAPRPYEEIAEKPGNRGLENAKTLINVRAREQYLPPSNRADFPWKRNYKHFPSVACSGKTCKTHRFPSTSFLRLRHNLLQRDYPRERNAEKCIPNEMKEEEGEGEESTLICTKHRVRRISGISQ